MANLLNTVFARGERLTSASLNQLVAAINTTYSKVVGLAGFTGANFLGIFATEEEMLEAYATNRLRAAWAFVGGDVRALKLFSTDNRGEDWKVWDGVYDISAGDAAVSPSLDIVVAAALTNLNDRLLEEHDANETTDLKLHRLQGSIESAVGISTTDIAPLGTLKSSAIALQYVRNVQENESFRVFRTQNVNKTTITLSAPPFLSTNGRVTTIILVASVTSSNAEEAGRVLENLQIAMTDGITLQEVNIVNNVKQFVISASRSACVDMFVYDKTDPNMRSATSRMYVYANNTTPVIDDPIVEKYYDGHKSMVRMMAVVKNLPLGIAFMTASMTVGGQTQRMEPIGGRTMIMQNGASYSAVTEYETALDVFKLATAVSFEMSAPNNMSKKIEINPSNYNF